MDIYRLGVGPGGSASRMSTKRKSKRVKAEPTIGESEVYRFMEDVLDDELHKKRVLSLSHGVLGVLHAAAAAVHAIGQGLAVARGLDPKHAVKQVDRLLSNAGVRMDQIFNRWVPFVVAERKDILVTLDWTEHPHDEQSTIAINMVTSHGRATPLVWKTVRTADLKGRRASHEDEALKTLRNAVPDDVRITFLADRGFADQALYPAASEMKLDYVIRFRQDTIVTDTFGESKPAREWVPKNGRTKRVEGPALTMKATEVPAVVCVKKAKMKEAWCLVSSRADLSAAELVAYYGKRFTTEENFRDTKDIRFGLGLSATHIGDPDRRDRLLLLCALSQALLTLLGAACERTGLDRRLKANTSKKRTHSLFRQGMFWFSAIPTMRDDWFEDLMVAFEDILRERARFTAIFATI
jgi:hypothetical protein